MLWPQVPSPPGDEDEDFILVHHSDVQMSDKAQEVYTQLMKILEEQYEVCLSGPVQNRPQLVQFSIQPSSPLIQHKFFS